MNLEIHAVATEFSNAIPDIELDFVETEWKILLVARLIESELSSISKHLKITINDIFVIHTLFAERPKEMRPSALSKRLVLTNAAITGCLDRLADADLIERSKDPFDKRVISVHLTESGREVAASSIRLIARNTKSAALLGKISRSRRNILNDALGDLLIALLLQI